MTPSEIFFAKYARRKADGSLESIEEAAKRLAEEMKSVRLISTMPEEPPPDFKYDPLAPKIQEKYQRTVREVPNAENR